MLQQVASYLPDTIENGQEVAITGTIGIATGIPLEWTHVVQRVAVVDQVARSNRIATITVAGSVRSGAEVPLAANAMFELQKPIRVAAPSSRDSPC